MFEGIGVELVFDVLREPAPFVESIVPLSKFVNILISTPDPIVKLPFTVIAPFTVLVVPLPVNSRLLYVPVIITWSVGLTYLMEQLQVLPFEKAPEGALV